MLAFGQLPPSAGAELRSVFFLIAVASQQVLPYGEGARLRRGLAAVTPLVREWRSHLVRVFSFRERVGA